MPLTVLQHALAAQILTRLRDATTAPEQFRPLTRALTQILLVEATRDLPTIPVAVRTPLEETEGAALAEGIVADGDLVDAGAIFGTGFAPFRGGPLQYALHKG